MGIGHRLAQLRKEKGYTRAEFAEILGISKYTLRNYELDVTDPGHTFLKQMSDFFNVSADYLVGLTDEKEKYSSYQLKSSEYEHINKYRDLDTHGKKMVDFTLNEEWERATAESKVIPIGVNKDSEFSAELAPENDYLLPNAAHADDYENAPEELKQLEEDIMDDENF